MDRGDSALRRLLHRGKEYFPTAARIGRWLVRIAPRAAVGALILFVVAAIVWTYFNIKWGRQIEAELAALKAQGKPVTAADLVPDPVPEDQNAATLYMEAFGLSEEDFLHAPSGDGTPLEELDGVCGLSAAEHHVFRRYVERGGVDLREECRRALARPEVQDALQTLRRASQRAQCVFPVNWEAGFGVLFTHYSKLLTGSHLVAAQAEFAAEEGRMDQALEWCEVGLRISEHAREPCLIGQLVSYTMEEGVLNAMRGILSSADVTRGDAAALQECLSQIDLYASLTAAFEGDRAFAREAFDLVVQDPEGMFGHSGGLLPLVHRVYASPVGKPWRKLDQLAYIRHTSAAVDCSRLPHRPAKAKMRELDHEANAAAGYLFVSALVTPVWSGIIARRDETVADIGLCRVALALKAYKHEHGSYPASLAELQEGLDWELPTDPFGAPLGGQRFIYGPQGEGFKLYSIGADLDDDGGTPKGTAESDLTDVVWECVR